VSEKTTSVLCTPRPSMKVGLLCFVRERADLFEPWTKTWTRYNRTPCFLANTGIAYKSNHRVNTFHMSQATKGHCGNTRNIRDGRRKSLSPDKRHSKTSPRQPKLLTLNRLPTSSEWLDADFISRLVLCVYNTQSISSLFFMSREDGAVRAPRFEGEDVSPTTERELRGWYSTGLAAEIFAVCGVGMDHLK